jgi:hypothetical protein
MLIYTFIIFLIFAAFIIYAYSVHLSIEEKDKTGSVIRCATLDLLHPLD